MLTSICALSIVLFAQADEAKEQAKKLMNRGNQAFALDDFEGALSEFEKAYEIYPSAKILLNIAEAHRALDHFVEAVDSYEQFLAEAPRDDEMVAQVESRIAELNEKVGRIEVGADEVEVSIDGVVIEGTKSVVKPGQHKVVVRREGYQDFERMVAVAPGQTETLDVQLEQIPSAAPPPPAIAAETQPEPVEDDGSVTGKWWFWTATGAAVLAVVGVSLAVAFTTGGDDFVPMGELPRARTTDWETF